MSYEAGLRKALKKVSYGFHIITTKTSNNQEHPYAAGIICWISQVSFDPPLVMVAIRNDSDIKKPVQETNVFAINTLGKSNQSMIGAFAKKTVFAKDKLNDYSFVTDKTGSPIFLVVPSYFECKVTNQIKAGDHVLFIGEVVNNVVRNEGAEPLTVWETKYSYSG